MLDFNSLIEIFCVFNIASIASNSFRNSVESLFAYRSRFQILKLNKIKTKIDGNWKTVKSCGQPSFIESFNKISNDYDSEIKEHNKKSQLKKLTNNFKYLCLYSALVGIFILIIYGIHNDVNKRELDIKTSTFILFHILLTFFFFIQDCRGIYNIVRKKEIKVNNYCSNNYKNVINEECNSDCLNNNNEECPFKIEKITYKHIIIYFLIAILLSYIPILKFRFSINDFYPVFFEGKLLYFSIVILTVIHFGLYLLRTIFVSKSIEKDFNKIVSEQQKRIDNYENDVLKPLKEAAFPKLKVIIKED